jgi:hypothetical protein
MTFSLLDISNWLEAHELPCMFKALTHFDCPGCGMQRSFILLLKGDVTGSFFMYPALVPVLVLFVFLILHVTLKFRQGPSILKFAYIICAGIILVSYIYKVLFTKTL